MKWTAVAVAVWGNVLLMACMIFQIIRLDREADRLICGEACFDSKSPEADEADSVWIDEDLLIHYRKKGSTKKDVDSILLYENGKGYRGYIVRLDSLPPLQSQTIFLDTVTTGPVTGKLR